MDKFVSRLRNIKFRVPAWINAQQIRKLGARSIVFWGMTVLVAVGTFFFARGLTTCWQITPLPGVRPNSCPGDAVASVIETPSVNSQGTPIAPPPTPVDVTA